MKKIIAFMMAFVFCFLCIGTLGFENATVCTEDHDHASHLHAADPVYMLISVESNYDASDEELTVDVKIEMSEKVDLYKNFKITFTGASSLGSGSTDIDVDGTPFDGVAAEIDSNKIIFDLDGSAYEDFESGEFTIVYSGLDEDDFNTKSKRKRSFTIATSNAKDTSGDKFTLNETSFYVYVCEHDADTTEQVLVAATCNKEGITAVNCDACGCTVDTDYILPIEHDLDYTKPFTNIYAYIAPTCTKTGYGQFKCKLCETLVTTTVPASHTYGASYLNSNGKYEQKCTLCGSIKVSTCDHNFKYNSTTTKATCYTKGIDVYKCSKCGITENRETATTSHSYGSWTTTKAATCDAKGEKSRTCSICLNVEKQDIAMIDHDFGSWKVVTEATCISNGLERRTCSDCGAKEEQTLEKSGHRYGGWKVDTAATCVTTGLNKRTCTLCGDVQTEVTDKVAHTYGAWFVDQAATCVATGVEKRICSVCAGADTRTLAIDADAHAYGDWKVVDSKTCVTDGVKSHTCTLCNHVEEDVDVAEGHKFGDAEVDGKVTTKECLTCGYTESIKTAKKGDTKTLADYSGSLVITGSMASKDKDVVFEIGAMTPEDENYYKQYCTFDKGYEFKVLVDGEEASITSNMALSLELDSTFDGYDISVVVLRDGKFFGLNEFERDGEFLMIEGSDLTRVNEIFIVKGEESSPNIWLPIVITVAILAVAGVAVVAIMSKGKSKNTFN